MLQPETKKNQSALASYCRSGQMPKIEGVHQRHVKHYRRLVYNVVDDMLQSAFPITYDFLEKEQWDELVQDFFTNHPCQSPQIWYMPKEFYEYHARLKNSIIKSYPFLIELLWFEWLEVELFMMEDKKASFTTHGSVSTDALVLNPEHHFQHFSYPVHTKKPSAITFKNIGEYYLVLHRDPESGSISFTEVTAPTLHMLELLANEPLSAGEVLQKVSLSFNFSINEQTIQYAFEFFQKALADKLILGFINRKHYDQ